MPSPLQLFRATPPFLWSRDPQGLAVVFADGRAFERARSGRGDERLQLAWLRMRILLEQGQADEANTQAQELGRGIFLATEQAVRLDEDTREIFALPPPWPGSFRLSVHSVPHEPNFSASLILRDALGRDIRHWQVIGPVLEVGAEHFLPHPEQYAVLRAMMDWSALAPSVRDEYANLLLLARLNAAREAGCRIDLNAYSETRVEEAGEFEVEAREAGDGELSLVPRFAGSLEKFNGLEIERRLHQLGGDAAHAVLRIQNQDLSRIVLLSEEQTRLARTLVRNRRVPAKERAEFLRDPASWLSGHVFADVDAEFCPRVTGIEIWHHRYFGGAMESGIDWFDQKPKPERVDAEAKNNSSDSRKAAELDGDSTTDLDSATGGPVVPRIHDNDEQRTFGRDKLALQEGQEEAATVDATRYCRAPLPHQIEAIGWLLAHARRISHRQASQEKDDPGGGVLLADDMGLGKTFSTLVFLGEWIRQLRESGREPEAVLVVAPVTLIENWRSEIAKSYPDADTVFRRVTYAYPEGELGRFKTTAGRDEADPGEGDPQKRVRSWGLVFNTNTPQSLDWPGSLIFTTYATLRNYRFSFGACRWSAAIFDEAQNLKNPNALQTVAAKALNARYRVLATGTPVENHLGDLWSLFDLAEPGFLDSFQNFRRRYIAPLLTNREQVGEVGRELRTRVGGLMLRRLKEDQLQGLPRKTVILHENVRTESFDSRVVATMSGTQRELYDQAREMASAPAPASAGGEQQQNRWLSALWHLREVTLHPALLGGGRLPIGSNTAECERILRESAKLGRVLDILERIRASNEKVLIFAVNKRLQEGLAGNLARIYGSEVPVINGDAPTGTRSQRPEAMNRTRFGMIENFQAREGFHICILSPLAAGVGLTITAANHVIHLERHWNPAKEAQATDRVYRIGQKLPVFVHVPILLHPERASYDVNLDRLLRSKTQLHDALTIAAPEEVTAAEMMGGMFGDARGDATRSTPRRVLRPAEVATLSWELFEALVAELYAREAREVILTPRSADHGCDAVVLGHAEAGNALIQCKHTTAKTYDGDAAIREVASSRAHYEHRTGEKFDCLAVHSPCRDFSRQARAAAKLYDVELYGAEWFIRLLGCHKVTYSEIMLRSATRRQL